MEVEPLSSKLRSKHKKNMYTIAHNNSKSLIAEQYKLIRTNIQFSSVDKEIKSIVVTSPEPHDGKTTTASNLAVVFAQQGKKVLLLDTDLRKPSVHYSFNSSNITGLTSILTNQVNLEDAILQTEIPNLDIITSGPVPPNPSEILNSEKMERILGRLRSEYDYVILDTPPVLIVADPQIVANKCDGVIMVVASGKTAKKSALKAKDLLMNSGTTLLGAILNGSKQDIRENYYYQP